MQWDSSTNAVFSNAPAAQLYLPIDPAATRPTVASQISDSKSLLRTVQALIALRKAHPALQASGEFEPLVAEQRAWPFVFSAPPRAKTILVALNPTDRSGTTDASRHGITRRAHAAPRRARRLHPHRQNLVRHLPPVSFAVVRVGE
jgi:glycosidase